MMSPRTRRSSGIQKSKVAKYLLFLTAFAVGFFYSRLSDNTLRIPGLSSIIHIFDAVMAPFVPFFAAIFLSLFFRIFFSPPFPGRVWKLFLCATWVFIFSAASFTELSILIIYAIRDWRHGNGSFGMWFETALLVVVLLLEVCGIKWDRGRLDKIVKAIADLAVQQQLRKEVKREEEEALERMEQGLCAQEETVEEDQNDEEISEKQHDDGNSVKGESLTRQSTESEATLRNSGESSTASRP
ncbi:hypothetical protein B0J14DRAFT_335244 [Halenospora varia]|nr:hypothetical protein B0J14DRAFT_335244 [Halenospora varia]